GGYCQGHGVSPGGGLCHRPGAASERRTGDLTPAPTGAVSMGFPQNFDCGTGGHKGRPYRHAFDLLVGAGFIPARVAASATDPGCRGALYMRPCQVAFGGRLAGITTALGRIYNPPLQGAVHRRGSYRRRHEGMPPYGAVDHCGAPCMRAADCRPYDGTSRMEREMRFFFSSTSSTTTFTTSPTETTSEGCRMNFLHTLEMCTRPSWWTPMSTNTPKSMTLRTVPESTMPGFKSFISRTSVRRMGAGSSSRGSRPGFKSSLTISRRVGSPTP